MAYPRPIAGPAQRLLHQVKYLAGAALQMSAYGGLAWGDAAGDTRLTVRESRLRPQTNRTTPVVRRW